MASIQKRPNGSWRARYRDANGKEHAAHRPTKREAQAWLDGETAKLVTGTWTSPRDARTTVAEWCETWLRGFGSRRPRTVLQARSHVAHIVRAFGDRPLASIKPSDVRSWVVQLKAEGFADSTVRAFHSRLSQVFSDAVHDNIIPRSPVSRRTAPGGGSQRPYVATTEQVWALHDAMPEGLRPAVLLAAFAGLRLREIVALRVTDVDFMRGIISPSIQYPAEPLKTEVSKTPIPIPRSLALELNRMPAKWGSSTVVVSVAGRPASPSALDVKFREIRQTIGGLPEGFRLHDLRHYFASLLIASGCDVKIVQARLRHASAKTTLDTYAHLWPDSDEASRSAVGAVFAARADGSRTEAATSP